MQTLTESEIDKILDQWSLETPILQQSLYNEKVLQLKFEEPQGSFFWLTFSLKPGNPFFFFSRERIFLIRTLKKPLRLFLQTHFVGRELLQIKRDKERGRVVRLEFEDGGVILLTLVPGRVNIEAAIGEKQVFAFKPKELKADFKPDNSVVLEREDREPSFFKDHWQSTNCKGPSSKEAPDVGKQLKKKKSGLKKMLEKQDQMENSPWSAAGEWLKAQVSLDEIPHEFQDFIDSSQSLAWNIETAFEQAKKSKAKLEGTKQRVQELQEEIKKLESGEAPKASSKPSKSLLAQGEAKGKTIAFDCGRLFIGKSGPDNLKLLRKARPWYLWLHIKDYPGAYGILETNKKNQVVSPKTLEGAGRAVIKQSLPKGASGRFDLIYAECRYVRPIKGAKSGQVTYSHEKVITVKV